MIVVLATGCDDGSGPSLASDPALQTVGQIAFPAGEFVHDKDAVCAALSRQVVPRATSPTSQYTTTGDQTTATFAVTGHRPAPWATMPRETRLVSCTWLSNRLNDLKGLYVVKRGAGLRQTGTYVGTAVVDRTGRWTPHESVSFDAYD